MMVKPRGNRGVIESQSPDIFLSYSHRDKELVRRLAEDLAICEVDAWLDDWELGYGTDLDQAIKRALEGSKFVGVVMADNYLDSQYAQLELDSAMDVERENDKVKVLPLVFANVNRPNSIVGRIHFDFQVDYNAGLSRLAAFIHGIERQHIEEAIRTIRPDSIRGAVKTLTECGKNPYVIMTPKDGEAILLAGGQRSNADGDRIRFDPAVIESSVNISPRLRKWMKRLREEVW